MGARVRGDRQARRAWLYALRLPPAALIIAPWAKAWEPHRANAHFVLRSIHAAYQLRHDPRLGSFAREALKAQFAALAAFDLKAPDCGAHEFSLTFNKFRGDWNALVAAHAQTQPHRAAAQKRLTGEATRNDVKVRWAADEKEGNPVRGRIGRIAKGLGRPYGTVHDAVRELGLAPSNDLRKAERKPAKNG